MIGEPVGREREIELLDAFLARPDGELLVALIVGDPGIGKTTLWQRAVEAGQRRSMAVLTSRPAETERDLTNLVLGDLFRDIPAALLSTLPGARRHAFEAALLMDDAPDAAVDRRALGVAVATVLRSMTEQRAMLIAIDDDQWMDAASADTLAFALRRLVDRPIRLLLSRRAGTDPVLPLERLVDGEAVARVDVGPLSVGAVQLLLRDRLGVAYSRPTLRELHRVSGGNAFHALELGRARSRDATRDLALPLADVTVDALLRARLHELDGATTRALLLVAAHGRTPVELLDRLDVPAGVVDRAVDASILERSGTDIGFAHPLLATAVYEGAGSEARRAAHRRLAAVLDDPVQRGRHRALGAAGPGASISAELERVAQVARERGTSVAAADLAERAVALTPRAAVDDRDRRTLAAARARLEAGDGERGRALVSSLLDVLPAGPRRAEALLLAARLEPPGVAVGMLSDALRAASDKPRLRALIHADLAAEGRFTRGRAWAERHVLASLRLATATADDAARARALSMAAMVRFDGAQPDAGELAQEAYRLALRANDDPVTREAATIVAHVLTWSGDTARARSWLDEQLASWRDRDEMVTADCLWYLSIVELHDGRWVEAAALAEEAAEIRTLYGFELPPDHLPAALIALHRGDFEVARRHSERALSLASGMVLPGHVAILATVDLWSGDPIRALAGFERAEAAADARGFIEPAMRDYRAEYGEALLRAGRIDAATMLVDEWEALAAAVGRDRESASAIRIRGLIAAAGGDLETATALLDDAAARHEAAGDRFGWARSRLASGIVYRRLRRKRLAREAFAAAMAAFDELGARSWAAETRAESARLGGRERIEGMSPSERRVAELVAEGRSNREIAASLFLTERTVASHLAHVYAKLGVRSRTQLARVVAEDESNIPRS